MFSVTDIKASITSLEFSLFWEPSQKVCPNCGYLLDDNIFTEVRLTSLVLLLGVGSIVCYKWMTEKKKRRLPFGLSKQLDENSIDKRSVEQSLLNSHNSKIRRYKMLSSTPFVQLCQSLDLNSPSVVSSDGSDLFFNFTDLSDENDSSIQRIGNNTVAKLDQLLEQIQDIKQSVYEMDEQIFDVKDSNVKFEPKMYRLGPDMTSSINTDSDLNEKFDDFHIEPQTPTLEWDLTDLNAFNGTNAQKTSGSIYENHMISSLNSLNLRTNSLIQSSNISFELSPDLESPGPLRSPSFSTSGEFSISSPTEQSKEHNLAAIQKIITEAKKLGLLKDLIDVLVKSSKRDSAYFED